MLYLLKSGIDNDQRLDFNSSKTYPPPYFVLNAHFHELSPLILGGLGARLHRCNVLFRKRRFIPFLAHPVPSTPHLTPSAKLGAHVSSSSITFLPNVAYIIILPLYVAGTYTRSYGRKKYSRI